MKKMESGYICEVLHFLLRSRYGTPLVKFSIDLVEMDNEAPLDLLCALFKHSEYDYMGIGKGGGQILSSCYYVYKQLPQKDVQNALL